MLFKVASFLLVLSTLEQYVAAAHGDGAEGTVMGPVAFLWPSDRTWGAAWDNIGPCGSASMPSNRTNFPLGAVGSIELTIADDAENLAIRIAYGNDPTTQADFTSIKNNVSDLDPGHQCYPIPAEPSTVTSGSNATIQLEYWANDSNKNESFFACADITFVEQSAFTENVACFNVTASEFETPSSTIGSSTPTNTAPSSSTTLQSKGGLSAGAKAGIAVGSLVGAAVLFAAVFFAVLLLFIRPKRQSRAAKDRAHRLDKLTASGSRTSGETGQ